MGRVALYYHTVKNMKPTQVLYRLRIKMGKGCTLGANPSKNYLSIQRIESPENLDFDSVFLARFPVEELMEDRVSILHSSKTIDWKTTWKFEDKSALWNFNLHYFEYLFPLVKAWRDTGEKRYLDKTVEMIEGWIDGNPIGIYPAWASYTTAIRIVTWISYYGYVSEAMPEKFREKFLSSLHEQYVHLARHLEKDILGNHYFEDMKSLVIAALFFRDDVFLEKVLKNFKIECKEEILPDGMHFELSPMYHKIIFEGILRVSIALRGTGLHDSEIESYIQPMLDVAYSFENGLERLPLFNDGGNNVAKSLSSLQITANQYFNCRPSFKSRLESSGFYIFEKDIDGHRWKLVVDAGQPGPTYIPGHAHCDAMSFELFRDGKPIVVNCGTYAYQCEERSFFRSTAAHNTVMIEGTEQCQCWDVFRMAKRSSTRVLDITNDSIMMEMIDQKGQKVKRTIVFEDNGLFITDIADGQQLISFIHILGNMDAIITDSAIEKRCDLYAVEYGTKIEIPSLKMTSKNNINVNIDLKSLYQR